MSIETTFQITFTIDISTIISAYNSYNSSHPTAPYDSSNRMSVTSSDYTVSPAETGNPAAINIGSNTDINISLENEDSSSSDTIIFNKFIDVQGTLVDTEKNTDGDASLDLDVDLPESGSATETFDINFKVESGSNNYYFVLDPRLRANQGQN